jgi:hypothetical protein
MKVWTGAIVTMTQTAALRTGFAWKAIVMTACAILAPSRKTPNVMLITAMACRNWLLVGI